MVTTRGICASSDPLLRLAGERGQCSTGKQELDSKMREFPERQECSIHPPIRKEKRAVERYALQVIHCFGWRARADSA